MATEKTRRSLAAAVHALVYLAMIPILDLDAIAPAPMVPPWLARALGEVGTLVAPGDADNTDRPTT